MLIDERKHPRLEFDGVTDELPLPAPLIAAVDRYADEVYEYNVAVKLDVGIDEAGRLCLAAEAGYKAAVREYGKACADAAVVRERERMKLIQSVIAEHRDVLKALGDR